MPQRPAYDTIRWLLLYLAWAAVLAAVALIPWLT